MVAKLDLFVGRYFKVKEVEADNAPNISMRVCLASFLRQSQL